MKETCGITTMSVPKNVHKAKAVKPVSRLLSDRGFTLIEIMIALFLIVTALLGLMSTTAMVIKANSLSKMMTTATTLAQDKMEELKNRSFANIASGGPETVDTVYTRDWVVTTPLANTKMIVVTVTWSWQGSNHNVTLNSLVGS